MAPQNPMTVERMAIIWHEWRKGTPMSVICRIIDKPAATVFEVDGNPPIYNRGDK